MFSLSQILECVTVNLTLVYALFSYATLKHRDLNKILVSQLYCAVMCAGLCLPCRGSWGPVE